MTDGVTDALDLVVLGGGPGGYVAAIRAAQLGAKVAVVDDQQHIGGVCLNWGCIPTKALLHTAEIVEFLSDAKTAEAHGLQGVKFTLDFPRVVARSREVVASLGKGTAGLLKKNGVEVRKGRGRVAGPGRVEVGGTELRAKNLLIATGSKPRGLPGVAVDGEKIFTSREILETKRLPASLLVLGAGAIGMEFAYFFRALGTEVTVVEMLDRILPMEDPEVSEALARVYARKGYDLRTSTKLLALAAKGKGIEAEVETKGKREKISAEAALIAIGVVPNTEGLFPEGFAPRVDAKGWIEVDDGYRTSLPGLYAIGDVAGPPWLAHVASHEGIACVEGMFSAPASAHEAGMDYDRIPGCTYCRPEVASVGLTEPAARAQFGDGIRVGKFPFRAIGRAIASGEVEGFVKLVFAAEGAPGYGRILGAHILGGAATEMIAELALALRLEATPEDLIGTVHAHPTLAEAVVEASLLAARGSAIHL